MKKILSVLATLAFVGALAFAHYILNFRHSMCYKNIKQKCYINFIERYFYPAAVII